MAADTQRMPALIPSYRRNGKLFSCEPCRRGKLRCDHNAPTCGRCTRRNKPDQCFYHPAPLTRPRSSAVGTLRSSASPSPKTPLTLPYPALAGRASDEGRRSAADLPPTTGHPVRSAQARPSENDSGAYLASSRASVAPSSSVPRQPASSSASQATPPDNSMSFMDSKHGYLGATSYSAVFSEYDATIQAAGSEVSVTGPDDLATLPPLSAEKIQQGADVLVLMRDMALFDRFAERWGLANGRSTLQPVVTLWMELFWAEHGRTVRESDPGQLRQLSELVFRNTRQPMQEHAGMTAEQWASSASGRNIRWEVVGLILTLVCISALSISNWDSIFDTIRDSYVDRATFEDRMRRASDFCLCVCYESEVLNDIHVSLMYENLILVGGIKGDAHYAAWQRNGEVCDMVVALGYHQGQGDADTPFFLQQLRKRVFCMIYTRDKMLATFLGRPPRLSYRYCKIQLPLDLPDHEIVLQGAELEQALSRLDENGWDTSDTVSRVKWIRVMVQQYRLREHILELALGPGNEEQDLVQRAEVIRQQNSMTHKSWPDVVKASPEEILDKAEALSGSATGQWQRDPLSAIETLYFHLGDVQVEFLLQRALMNQIKSDSKPLIAPARRMLSIILLAHAKRDFFRDLHGDLTFLMVYYGLPSAAVLSLELLKQEQTRQYTPDIMPRSQLIQDLSVFIAALGTVRPGEGNYAICAQGQRALKRVMDQILSPPVPGAGGAEQTLLDGVFFEQGNDADFLQWLDSVEWDKAFDVGAGNAISTNSEGNLT